MGNKVSLDVQVESGYDIDHAIVAGKLLKGKVLVRVRPRRVHVSSLFVNFEGKEVSLVKAGRYHKGEEYALLRARKRLRPPNQEKLERGLHEFRFEFIVPVTAPSSILLPVTRRSGCSVQYKVVATTGLFRAEKEINIVSAPLPNAIVPCLLEPTTHNLKSFGFLDQGMISFGASVEDSHIGRGQFLSICIASRNDAHVEIDRVRVKLVEIITWKADGETNTRKIPLKEIGSVDLPSLCNQKKSRAEVRKSIKSWDRNVEATYYQMYRELVSGDNKIQLQIPDRARDSYSGKFITVTHYVKITFFTKALVENPSTKIPIRIGTPSVGDAREARTIRVESVVATALDIEFITQNSCEEGAEVIPHDDDDDDDDNDNCIRIPMANAILLERRNSEGLPAHPRRAPSDDASTSSTVILGLDAVYVDEADNEGFDGPIAPPTLPSLDRLLYEFHMSVNHYEVVLLKTHHPEWIDVFRELSVEEFGDVIGHVAMESQARVAIVLAKVMGKAFTCDYCAATIQNTNEYFRSNMVEVLLPLCSDLIENHGAIRSQLTEWEQTICARAFEDAYHAKQTAQ